MSLSNFRIKKESHLICIAKKIFFVAIFLVMILSLVSCGEENQTEETYNETVSSEQTDSTENKTDIKNQDAYEILLETSGVNCEYLSKGKYYFFHKSGDYIFYTTLDFNPCLMSLNIKTKETKQIAYINATINDPIQYSSTHLIFNGSESGYNMQYLLYDIANEALSIVLQGSSSYNGKPKLVGNRLVFLSNNHELCYIDLSKNDEKSVCIKKVEEYELIIDKANDNIFYYNDLDSLYSYDFGLQKSEFICDLDSFIEADLIEHIEVEYDNGSDYVTVINGCLYVFTEEQGVYSVDSNGSPVQISQYPADGYLIYETEQKFIYQNDAIYYRAASPHDDLIIKLENGKETIIKPAEKIQTENMNLAEDVEFTGLLAYDVQAIHNDEVWYNLIDENVNENNVRTYDNYIAAVDDGGNIKNIFAIEEFDIIAIDDDYMYCYGWLNKEERINNGADIIRAFIKVKIDDTAIN